MAECQNNVTVAAHGSSEELWDDLVRRHGSPFQTLEFCRIFERSWSGTLVPRHVAHLGCKNGGAVIPAYLYESCPRLDYYRRVHGLGLFSQRIVLSHALVGWYGFPVAASETEMLAAIEAFKAAAREENAIALFAGIDERDRETIRILAECGFMISHFHTTMVRKLEPKLEKDAVSNIEGRYRRSRGNKIRAALKRGVRTRLGVSADYQAGVELIAAVLDRTRVASDVLPRNFVAEVVRGNLPGVELLVATEADGKVIGVNVTFNWGERYYVWLGGYAYNLLNSHHQSDLLYAACIERALSLGCKEIQAGRSPYTPKLEFGYRPVRLLAAAWAYSSDQREETAHWLRALEVRHLATYPELVKYMPALHNGSEDPEVLG